jgi:hypothetical protein
MTASGCTVPSVHQSPSLIEVSPQINDPSYPFGLNFLPEGKAQPVPKAAYYPRDATSAGIQAIVGCSDAILDNGLLTYVIGFNRILIEKVDSLPKHALLASAIAQALGEANAPEGSIGVFDAKGVRSLRVHGRTGRTPPHSLFAELELA